MNQGRRGRALQTLAFWMWRPLVSSFASTVDVRMPDPGKTMAISEVFLPEKWCDRPRLTLLRGQARVLEDLGDGDDCADRWDETNRELG